MAADLGGAEGADLALFDPQLLTGPPAARTIAEVLTDVDRQARDLLMRVEGPDAAGLLRGWPDLVAAAQELWEASPGPTPPLQLHLDALRVQAQSISQRIALEPGWPRPGPGDPRLAALAQTVREGAALMTRFGETTARERGRDRTESNAAHARLVHGLYLSAHAVTVALHARGRRRFDEHQDAGTPLALDTKASPYLSWPDARWVDRMNACEENARAFLGGGYYLSNGAGSAAPIERVNPDRLSTALARWDVEARRAAVTTPDASNIVLMVRTQAHIAAATLVVSAAAATTGVADPNPRFTDKVAQAGALWEAVARRWHDLVVPGVGMSPGLTQAASEVRSAVREFTQSGDVLVPPEVLGARPAIAQCVDALTHSMSRSSTLAQVVADRATAPELYGPAKAMTRRLLSDVDAGAVQDQVEPWIDLEAIRRNRVVPAPAPLTAMLQSKSHELVEASAALSAIAVTQPRSKDPRTSLHSHAPTRGMDAARHGQRYPSDVTTPGMGR